MIKTLKCNYQNQRQLKKNTSTKVVEQVWSKICHFCPNITKSCRVSRLYEGHCLLGTLGYTKYLLVHTWSGQQLRCHYNVREKPTTMAGDFLPNLTLFLKTFWPIMTLNPYVHFHLQGEKAKRLFQYTNWPPGGALSKFFDYE